MATNCFFAIISPWPEEMGSQWKSPCCLVCTVGGGTVGKGTHSTQRHFSVAISINVTQNGNFKGEFKSVSFLLKTYWLFLIGQDLQWVG